MKHSSLIFISYVCFDNNARAQFRARELKSIKINMEGEYVRLVIRNCHRNRLNTYNQASVHNMCTMFICLHFFIRLVYLLSKYWVSLYTVPHIHLLLYP